MALSDDCMVPPERNVRRPGRLATGTSGPRYRGALPCKTLSVSTATLKSIRHNKKHTIALLHSLYTHNLAVQHQDADKEEMRATDDRSQPYRQTDGLLHGPNPLSHGPRWWGGLAGRQHKVNQDCPLCRQGRNHPPFKRRQSIPLLSPLPYPFSFSMSR